MCAGAICIPTLLRVLNSSRRIDVYASLAHSRYAYNSSDDFRTLAYLRSITNLAGLRIDDYPTDSIPDDVLTALRGFPYANTFTGGSPVNVALQSLHLSKGWDLIEKTLGRSGHSYDIVVRTRPDICFHNSMKSIDLDTVMSDRVPTLPVEIFIPLLDRPLIDVNPSTSVPEGVVVHPLVMPTFDHWGGGWNDQIALGPTPTMKWYLQYISKIDEVCETEGSIFNGENTLKLSVIAHARDASRRTGQLHAIRLVKLPGFFHGICRVTDTTCQDGSCPPWNTDCCTINWGS